MQHPQLFHLSQGRFPLRLLRILRHRLQSRHGKNGRRSPDPGVVGRDDADAAAARHAQRGRVVGRDGRSLSHGLASTMKIVDTHQHLWDKDLFHYAWLEPLPKLDRSFRLSDYRDATSDLDIEKTLFVECDVDESQMMDEALHILRLADDSATRIAGIVVSGRPERDGFKAHLDALAAHPKVKGLRRILHTSPNEVGLGERFIENVSCLKEYGLSFDICVLARQLT